MQNLGGGGGQTKCIIENWKKEKKEVYCKAVNDSNHRPFGR